MKSRKIKITIPDGLSPKEEVKEIASRLQQKMLSGNGWQEDKKRIGEYVEVKHLDTEILIHRSAPAVSYIPCNVCSSEFQSDCAFPVWVNYGGKTRTIKTCSTNCQNTLIDFCGVGRASIKKKDLKPVRFFN